MTQRERIATAPSARANRWSVRPIEALSANRTLTIDEIERFQAFAFDLGATNRNVVLPPEESCAGAYLFISNSSSGIGIITIQNDAAGTVVTPAQNESALVWCDGIRWYGLVGAQS